MLQSDRARRSTQVSRSPCTEYEKVHYVRRGVGNEPDREYGLVLPSPVSSARSRSSARRSRMASLRPGAESLPTEQCIIPNSDAPQDPCLHSHPSTILETSVNLRTGSANASRAQIVPLRSYPSTHARTHPLGPRRSEDRFPEWSSGVCVSDRNHAAASASRRSFGDRPGDNERAHAARTVSATVFVQFSRQRLRGRIESCLPLHRPTELRRRGHKSPPQRVADRPNGATHVRVNGATDGC